MEDRRAARAVDDGVLWATVCKSSSLLQRCESLTKWSKVRQVCLQLGRRVRHACGPPSLDACARYEARVHPEIFHRVRLAVGIPSSVLMLYFRTAAFYWGYLVGVIPMALILRRFPLAKTLSFLIFVRRAEATRCKRADAERALVMGSTCDGNRVSLFLRGCRNVEVLFGPHRVLCLSWLRPRCVLSLSRHLRCSSLYGIQ
jgi:hypothetical protein